MVEPPSFFFNRLSPYRTRSREKVPLVTYRHPVYRGVRKRSWGKWVSEIRRPRKKSRIWSVLLLRRRWPLAAWLFHYLFRPSDQPLVLLRRIFSDRETLGLLVVSTMVVVFLTSVGSLLIFAHGAIRDPEDLFLDDQEVAGTGFLSFLGGAASSAAAAAGPAVVAGRV